MNSDIFVEITIPKAHQSIIQMLETLPPSGINQVEQFIHFLKYQESLPTIAEDTPYKYSTVSASPSTLTSLIGILTDDIDRDALEDTEALYNEA